MQPNQYPPQPPAGYGQQYPPPGQPAPGYPPQPQPGYGYPPPPQQPPAGYPPPAPAGAPMPPQGASRYAAPQTAPQGDRVTAGALDGHLLLVVPRQLHPGFFAAKAEKRDAAGTVIEAAKPASDAVEVNVVDLDGRGADGQAGKTYIGVMWGGKVLAGGLATQLGQECLGRMGKGVAKGSNAAPYLLNDETGNPQSVARADEFYSRHPNWQSEPGTDEAMRAPLPAAPAPGYPPQQAAPGYPPQPGYSVAPGPIAPPGYGQPAPGYPPQPGYPPAQPYPPQPGYPPQQPAPGYPPQPAAAYGPGVSGPGSPEAAAAYAAVQYQQGGYPQ